VKLVYTRASLFIVGRRNCPVALPGDPLLDVERAIDELDALRLTPHQRPNAQSIQKVDIFQVQPWRDCALFDFRLQFRQILLLNPAAELKDSGRFTQPFFDAQHSSRVINEEQPGERPVWISTGLQLLFTNCS
jgi:hypothetical protein